MPTIWLTVAQPSFLHHSVEIFMYPCWRFVICCIASSWPKISKPLKVVQTRHNKLSNRLVTYLFLQRPDCVVFTWFTMLLFLASFAFSAWKNTPKSLKLPSVLWHCWLSVREIIRTVKIEWSGVGVVIYLERAADCLHMVQLMPLPSQNPSCLASFKSRLVIPFWYRLT